MGDATRRIYRLLAWRDEFPDGHVGAREGVGRRDWRKDEQVAGAARRGAAMAEIGSEAFEDIGRSGRLAPRKWRA